MRGYIGHECVCNVIEYGKLQVYMHMYNIDYKM